MKRLTREMISSMSKQSLRSRVEELFEYIDNLEANVTKAETKYQSMKEALMEEVKEKAAKEQEIIQLKEMVEALMAKDAIEVIGEDLEEDEK